MSRLVVIEYISLDGVVQGPGHPGEDRDGEFEHGGWTAPLMDEHARYLTEPFQTAAGFLLGRKTYEIWATYWPTVTDPTDEIAKALNTQPKYVASTTLERPTWPETKVIRDVPREVAALRKRNRNPIIVMGSSALTHTLTAHGLIDEYRLLVHPVVLGRGKKLFTDGSPRFELKLIQTTTTAAGMVALTYARP
jgi:dihydrofolate reductase